MYIVDNGPVIVVQKCSHESGAGAFGFISTNSQNKRIFGHLRWVPDIERLSKGFRHCRGYSLSCVKLCVVSRKNGNIVHLWKANRIEVTCPTSTSFPYQRNLNASRTLRFAVALAIKQPLLKSILVRRQTTARNTPASNHLSPQKALDE